MNVNQVYLLVDLAQTHSFNQTAERLFTTQQNVSYQIKQLEQELGIRIFKQRCCVYRTRRICASVCI